MKRSPVLENGSERFSLAARLNLLSRRRVPDEKLRLMTGHKTEEITGHFPHLLEKDRMEISKVQRRSSEITKPLDNM